MKPPKSIKTQSAAKKVGLVLFFLALFYLCEPTFLNQVTFAVPNLDRPKIATDNLKPNYPIAEVTAPAGQQKSRAPEPSTLFLIFSGLTGMVVRFAQKSFAKFKRLADIGFSVLGLLIAAPVLLFAGILIRLTSPGQVIYKQERIGKNGKLFRIYKLRTMLVDAEKETGAIWAKKDDPRITPVGSILRKTHIDEIPQLINVLKGEMSIVGPRPERPEMVRDLKNLILDYEKRLLITPGITGLAQVWHKYDESIADVKKKVKYDLLYIRKMCWWVDLRILAQTFLVVLTGRGAR